MRSTMQSRESPDVPLPDVEAMMEAVGEVGCDACGHVQPDKGSDAACEHCGSSPMPTRESALIGRARVALRDLRRRPARLKFFRSMMDGPPRWARGSSECRMTRVMEEDGLLTPTPGGWRVAAPLGAEVARLLREESPAVQQQT